MMDWIAASLLAGGFILLLKPFRVIETSRRVVALSRTMMATIGDGSLSELDKEKAMQQHSLAFFRFFFIIALGCSAALATPFALVWLMQLTGSVSIDNTLAITLSWPFLAGSTVLGIGVLYLFSRTGKPQ